MTFLSVINHMSSATFRWRMRIMRDIRTRTISEKTPSDYFSQLVFHLHPITWWWEWHTDTHAHSWASFPRIHWPCFSLLMKQKLESLHCLTNPSKCLVAVLLLVLISKRMGLAGLSEVINIRGHKAMLIEWSAHCHAQGVSLLAPFLPILLFPIWLSHPLFSCMPLIQVPWRPSIAGAGFSHRQL